MSKIITLGKNFFYNEKRAYNNWKEAILKEILQNGLDSPGCTRMDFDFIKNEQTTKIIAKDNGAGMTLETLENVFLVLGESKKDGWNPIGGFGVARQLITFAMESYVIKSFNYICSGSGAMYDVKQTKETVRGCIFEIETDHHDWENELKGLLNKSSVNASVYINGEKYNNILHRGRKVRDLSFGELYVNKSANPGLYVRVRGLLMFSKWVNCKAQVCLEICPEKSKQVLTSNRYGLQHKESAELDEFLNELASESQLALKDRSRRFIKYINKSKAFVSRIKEISSGGKEVSINQIIPANLIPAAQTAIVKQIINYGPDSGYSGGNVALGDRVLPLRQEYLTKSICPILDSMVIYSDTNNENIKKVIKFYDPTENNGIIGADRHKFIKQWKSICEIIGEELSNLTKVEYLWAVGFCFDDDAIAMHMKNEGVSYVMINPVNKDGKLKYSLNNKKDLTRLTVSACHEFVHVAGFNLHNQDFVTCYDALLERVMPRIKDIFHACADAKNN